MKTVTTRRVIRPSAGAEEARVEPPRGEALQPRPRPAATGLWGAWQGRMADLEGQMAAALDVDLHRMRQLPRQPDLPAARRLQAVWQDPWSGLKETFEAAAASAGLGEALVRDYRIYLGLRDTQLRALVRCALAPGRPQVQQLEVAQAALDAFIAARRGG